LEETPVVFKSEGQQIVGILHKPAWDMARGPAPAHPVVVFFHGFTGHKIEVRRMFVRAARQLAAKGIAALRFDFRGSGDSEGDFSQMRVPGLVADARAALAFARELPGVDPARMGIVGFSMGGMIGASVLAVELSLRAAVLWSPVAHPGALVDDLRSDWTGGGSRRGMIDLGGWSVSRAFMSEYAGTKPLEAFETSRVTARVLLIHGNDDEVVPVGHSYDYQNALRGAGARVKLQVMEGAGHTFESIDLDRRVINATTNWLGRNL